MIKFLNKLIIFVLLCFTITACTNRNSKNIHSKTIRFVFWDENQRSTVNTFIKLFQEKNPDIKVKSELVPWSQYWTKLDASAMAGDMPDVMWMNTDLPKYVRADLIEPLDKYIRKDRIDLKKYEANMVELYNYNGWQYAMPKGLDVVVVFFNKNIFKKFDVNYPCSGWTWNDMILIGKKLKNKTFKADLNIYPLVMELDPQPSYFNLIYQEGGYVFSKDGLKNGFDLPEDYSAYNKIMKLMRNGIMPSYAVLSDTKGTDLFLSQKAAMLYMGTWQAANMEKASFAKNIGVIEMPKIKNNVTVMGGIGYCMSANSKNKDSAWKFIKFLSGYEANKIQGEQGTDIPALISAQKFYVNHFKNIDASVFIKAAENSVPYPNSPYFAKCNGIIQDYQSDIFSGRLPLKTALKEMSEEMDIIMNSKNKK